METKWKYEIMNVKINAVNELLNAKIEANDRNNSTRLAGMDIALEEKEKVLNHRLSELNELRRDVIEDRDTFIKKDTYETKMESVDKMENRITVLETRLITVGGGIALFVVLLQLILHYWKV